MGHVTIRTAAAVTAALAFVAGNLDAQLLRGSSASVDRMYQHAASNNFDFFRTAAEVNAAVKRGTLVKLFETGDMELHGVTYPYVKDEVKLFAERLSSQYQSSCGERLVVTGATRPMNMKLANASDLSVHPTGMAIDVRKPSGRCLSWLRTTLTSLEDAGVIEATEERSPPHFHIAVFPAPYANYVAAVTGKTTLAQARASLGVEPSAEIQLVAYNVRNGDSLWRIAQKHDTTVQALQDMNKLRGSTIHPGQVILVPTAAAGK